MAHFAELDENNIVVNVYTVSNDVLDENDEEGSGIEFLTSWSGGITRWKQTSYNATIRKNYAGIGYSYEEDLDAFLPPKPFSSWILDEDKGQWLPPIPRPNDGLIYFWNENDQDWEAYVEQSEA